MRVAIVEDHPAERQLVKTMCTAYFRDKHDLDIDCGTFTGTDDFIESWKSNRFDLVLLDCYLTDDETDATAPSHASCDGNAMTAPSSSSHPAVTSPCSAMRCRRQAIY